MNQSVLACEGAACCALTAEGASGGLRRGVRRAGLEGVVKTLLALSVVVGLVSLLGGCGREPQGPDESGDDPSWPILTCWVIDTEPDWSPDGSTIAYTHRDSLAPPDRFYQIWLLDLQTTEKRFLTYGLGWPAWSPDGKKIAFVKNNNIHVIDLESEAVTQLTSWGECFFPSWSPDGTRIVYGVGENRPVVPLDSTGIWIMNADGSGREQITWFYGSAPDWAPDGLTLALVWGLAENAPYGEIALLGLADSSVVRLTDDRRDDRHPAWSPDGGQIAWESYGEGSDPTSGVWVMSADGSNQHQVVYDEWKAGRPSWSPDGSKIVYPGYNRDSDTVTLWVVNADGTDPHPLTTPEDYE